MRVRSCPGLVSGGGAQFRRSKGCFVEIRDRLLQCLKRADNGFQNAFHLFHDLSWASQPAYLRWQSVFFPEAVPLLDKFGMHKLP